MVGVTGVILGWWLDRKGKRQINNASSSIFGGEKDTSVAIASATTSNGFQDQHVPVSALEWAVYMAKTTSVSPLPSTPLSQQHPTGEVNVLNHQLTNKNSLMRPMAKVMKPTAGVIEMSSTDPTIEGLAGGEGQR